MTFGEEGGETVDKGTWMSIWVDDVDPVYARCAEKSLDITFPPTDMPWNVREMHSRHPTAMFSESVAESKMNRQP